MDNEQCGMNKGFATVRRISQMLALFIIHCLLFISEATAHPMPNSVVLLNVHADRIDAEIQIPLVELQAAWGHAVNDSSAGLVARFGPQLRSYLTQHIRPESLDGHRGAYRSVRWR